MPAFMGFYIWKQIVRLGNCPHICMSTVKIIIIILDSIWACAQFFAHTIMYHGNNCMCIQQKPSLKTFFYKWLSINFIKKSNSAEFPSNLFYYFIFYSILTSDVSSWIPSKEDYGWPFPNQLFLHNLPETGTISHWKRTNYLWLLEGDVIYVNHICKVGFWVSTFLKKILLNKKKLCTLSSIVRHYLSYHSPSTSKYALILSIFLMMLFFVIYFIFFGVRCAMCILNLLIESRWLFSFSLFLFPINFNHSLALMPVFGFGVNGFGCMPPHIVSTKKWKWEIFSSAKNFG